MQHCDRSTCRCAGHVSSIIFVLGFLMYFIFFRFLCFLCFLVVSNAFIGTVSVPSPNGSSPTHLSDCHFFYFFRYFHYLHYCGGVGCSTQCR